MDDTCDNDLSRSWKSKREIPTPPARDWPLSKSGTPLEIRNYHHLLTAAAAAVCVSTSTRGLSCFHVAILCVVQKSSVYSSVEYFVTVVRTRATSRNPAVEILNWVNISCYLSTSSISSAQDTPPPMKPSTSMLNTKLKCCRMLKALHEPRSIYHIPTKYGHE